jgi:hypothetical protein
MAERTIGLRLQINGVPETITNIKQLESSIGKLEEELKGVDIGSAKFNQLTTEIRTARGRLEDFNKSTEGLGFEKLVESVGKFAGGVTGAFAAASAAVQLFGKDNEDVAKAAAAAQNVLTIAIGATTVAEGVLAAKKLFTRNATIAQTAATVTATGAVGAETAATVALTGAEVAATTATVGLTGAIKLLGNAIKSNPVLFIVGALAAAATAMAVFGDDTEEAEKAVADLDRTLRKTLDTLDDVARRKQNDLKIQLASAAAEGKSIEELAALRQKSYKEEIDLQVAKVRAINTAYLNELQILEKRKLSEEKYAEERKKVDDKYDSQRQAAIVARNNAEVNAEIDKINTLKEIQLRDLNISIANQKRKNELISAELKKGLADLKLSYEDELREAKKNGENINLVTQNYVKQRNDLIKQAQKELNNLTKTANKELLDIQGRNYQQQVDDVVAVETKKREELKKGLDNLKTAGVATQKDIDDTNKAIADSLATQQLKIQQIQETINKDYLQGQVDLFEKAKQLQTGVIETEEDAARKRLELFVSNFKKYKETELNKIKLALESAGVEKSIIDETLKKYEDYFNKLGLLQYNSQEIERGLTESTKQELGAQLELNQSYYAELKRIQDTYTTAGKLAQLQDAFEKEKALIQKNGGDLNALYEKYEKDKQKIYEEGEKESKQQKRDVDRARIQLELEFQAKQLKIQRDALRDRLRVLELDPTINPEKLKEVKAALLQVETEYNDKLLAIQKNTTTTTEEDTNELIANLQKGIEIFSSTISQIASLAAQSYSLQLERLELDYQNTLAKVVGDTEQANQKREELETMYQAQKKEIEKKARLTSLKIQIAQATADAASTILKTFAEYGFTPVGIALSALAAIMAGVQVGIIAQQIGVVKSMARGGFLRGPSHEQGGISYQAGGVEVEGNESVINRRSTLAYAPLLSQINMQGGGRPIYVNSIMDSRMAEVLAATKQEPIRAYVLEKDITKSQAVNRRLEQLASY